MGRLLHTDLVNDLLEQVDELIDKLADLLSAELVRVGDQEVQGDEHYVILLRVIIEGCFQELG